MPADLPVRIFVVLFFACLFPITVVPVVDGYKPSLLPQPSRTGRMPLRNRLIPAVDNCDNWLNMSVK